MARPPGFDGGGGGTGVLAPPPDALRKRRASVPPRFPPGGPDDPGEGGGGRGPGEGDERTPESTGRFALLLAMAGIATFFLVLLAVWLLLRRRASDWPPDGIFSPPRALWISTAFLVASSVAIERAARWARAGPVERGTVLRALGLGFVLGLCFLGAQIFLWRALWLDGLLPSKSGYGAVFYALTGLHGLHVAAGLLFLASLLIELASAAAFARRRYAVRLCASYWHFMGVIWLVLFALLYFVG